MKYRGIFPALYVCYDEEGNVDIDKIKLLVRYYIKEGVDGLYVNGSSGECLYLSVRERKKIIEAVLEEARGKIVIINHVACLNTKDSSELAKHAEEVKVDAIAALPPIYYTISEIGIYDYWNKISLSAPNTDFFLYHIPQLTNVSLTDTLLNKMLNNKNVCGVKCSSLPVMDISRFRKIGLSKVNNFSVFNGCDEQLVSGVVAGAVGGIGGTYGVMPDLYVLLYKLVISKKMDEAMALQDDINDIISMFSTCSCSMYAVCKALLEIDLGVNLGGVREPLVNLNEVDYGKITKIYEKIDNIRHKYGLRLEKI